MGKTRIAKDGKGYLIEGSRLYPRLSEVASSENEIGLRKWREKVGEEEADRIAEETSRWGTKVHAVTAYNDLRQFKKMDKMIEEDENLLPPLLAWQEYTPYIKTFVAIERIVWSDRYRVAGTGDRFVIFKGDKSLSYLDLKTGSLHESIGIKLAGYKIMWNEREKKRVERCLAISLPRKNLGDLKVKEYSDPYYEEEFIKRCEDYHKMYGG